MKWACRQFKWEIFKHPPYSPIIAPSDFHFFLHLKKLLASQTLSSDQETKDMHDWLKDLVVAVFHEGIQKLVP